MKKLLLVASLSFSTVAFAGEPDLKPAQEEAKEKFDKETAGSLKTMNEKCGISATIKSDFENFSAADWEGINVASFCNEVLDAAASLCSARPAYKKALGKKLSSVTCLVSGAKPAQKDDHGGAATQRNMTFEKGSFTFHMGKGQSNLTDNAKAVFEKALN